MAGFIRSLLGTRKSGGRTIESRDLLQEYLEKDMSRRRLLQGALASVAVASCGGNGGGGTTPVDAGTDAPTAATDTPPAVDVPPMRMPHLVGMGQHEDHIMAAELALQETHGFDFVQTGQRVYLKVNTNSGDEFPYSTSPDMIRWAVGKIRERGGEAFLGDRSFFGDRNTAANFRRNGITAVADELGVDLVVFGDRGAGDTAAVDWMDLPATTEGVGARSSYWEGTMRIPVSVAQADHIVQMACVKTHFIATFTMSLKNMIGIINPVDRSRMANLGNHDGRVGGKLFRQTAFMNKAGPAVSLVVLDGWQALVSGGPTPTDRPARAPSGFAPIVADPHVVILSRDRVAADLTGAAVLRTLAPTYEYIRDGILWNNRQLSVALQAGIGITDRAQYDLSGPSVENLETLRMHATAV